MNTSFGSLLSLFDRERAAGRALGLGVVVRASGSTYAKEGALIAFAHDGRHAGMISGGCLEGDLGEHSQQVISSGQARLVQYDLNDTQERPWGLGLGCGGTLRIMLMRVGPQNQWQPLSYFASAYHEHRAACAGIVCISESIAPGTVVLPHGSAGPPALQSADVRDVLARSLDDGLSRWLRPVSRDFELVTIPLVLPPRIVLLGGGPDSVPLVDFAIRLGWRVTVVDHRPAYADPARFPGAVRVVHARVGQLAQALDLAEFDAAVVMSHHLESDAAYLQALAASELEYIGLLGPVSRRDRLLDALGTDLTSSLRGRLRAPVGLQIGGRGPESIALAIVAEVHAHLHAVVPLGPSSATIRARLAQTAMASC